MSGPDDEGPKHVEELESSTNALGLSPERLRRYRAAMKAVARRGLSDPQHSDDVVHNAFVVAIGKEKSARPDLKDDEKWAAWLCTIVRFLVKRQNSKWRESPTPSEDLEQLVQEELRSYDDKATAQAAFDALSPPKQRLLGEHFLQERSIAEIAEEEGRPYTTTHSHFASALREARAFVDADSPRPRRRRAGTAVFPFLLLGMVTRVARAEMAVLWRRLFDSIARLPMRAVCGVAAGAALLGSTPLRDPCAMPGRGNGQQAETVTAEHRGDAMPVRVDLRIEPRSSSPGAAPNRMRAPVPSNRPRSAGHRAERSLEEVIDANAMRYVEQAPRTSTQ